MKLMSSFHCRAAAFLAPAMLVPLLAAAAPVAAGASDSSAPIRRSGTDVAEAAPTASAARLGAPLPISLRRGAVDHDRMMYDSPGDGSLWARGASYKASFDASGATYYPFFGKSAPHDYAHVLSPDCVTVGDASLAFERSASPVRDGDHVALNSGAFVESYDLAPQSVEQSFVFGSLPRQGDLVMHIPVASELDASASADGIEFTSDLGRVHYGRATAIDASGRRAEIATELADGAITLRVDASFLASTTFPLVVDPLVSTIFFPAAAGLDDFAADTAYDPTLNAWLVVWEETFSASDTDAYCRLLNASGATIADGTIDFTVGAWASPRCADLAAAQQFLVVGGVTSSGGTLKTVQSRTVKQSGSTLNIGPQTSVSDGAPGDKINPDVGGDPFLNSPSFYCVAYEHVISTNNHEIAIQMVGADGHPVNVSPTYLAADPTSPDETPSVSKSDDTFAWTVTWARFPLISHGDIWAAHVHWDGFVLDGPFGITATLSPFDFAPCASSPIHSTHRSMIAFTRTLGLNRDIMVALLDGTSVLSVTDLTSFENGGTTGLDQLEPSVDCDGQHFLVTYSEGASGGPYTVYADDLALSGTNLELAETHVLLHQFGLSERRSRVCAAHRIDNLYHRYMAVYDFEQDPTDHDVAGALFDAFEGGNSSTFCFGDGTQALACPCGNNGIAGHGCANSFNSQGAVLSMTGIVSTVDDSSVLHASGMPANATCVFLQGSSTSSGVLFGDGVRCAAGTLIRLGVKNSVSGQASYPGAGDLSIAIRGAIPVTGGTRAYQAWYRDNNLSFCTSQTYNISSGMLVNWAP